MNRIEFGDCREIMAAWPAGIVQTCVTSPPYFGLRDYGHAGQIGLEETPEQFIAKLVDVFREVRRVLRDDGTCWVNMGDSYAGSGRGGNSDVITGSGKDESKKARGSKLPAGLQAGQVDAGAIGRAWVPPPAGLKQKELIGIPWMLAFALRADGWYLRQDIIWSKSNPMPESVKDRCTKAHEYLFLLSKSRRYYFDNAAMQEPCTSSEKDLARAKLLGRGEQPSSGAYLGSPQRDKSGGFPTRSRRDSFKRDDSKRAAVIPGQSAGTHRSDRKESGWPLDTRNRRSVWNVAVRPYKGAHFATFPPDLIEPCVLAGAPAGGVVLDPFMGSGTTAQVAITNGRRYLGCELNPAYGALQQERIFKAMLT